MGFVTDMISTVFNIADICVTVGCAVASVGNIGDRKLLSQDRDTPVTGCEKRTKTR